MLVCGLRRQLARTAAVGIQAGLPGFSRKGDIDMALAKAHSIVGAKYPGAIPYLNMIQGLKDQILSGADSSEV